jgi:hypothetical protein
MQNTTQESESKVSESTSSESQESPPTSPRYAYQSDPLYLRQGYDLTSPFGEMVQTFLRIIHRHTLSDISDDEMTLDKEEVFRKEIGWSEADEMEEEAIWTDEDIEVIRNVDVKEEQEVEMREWSTDSEREEGEEEEMEYEGGEEIDEEGYLGWDEGQGMRGEWMS